MPKCRICKVPTIKRFGLTYACSIEHALEAATRAKLASDARKAKEALKAKKAEHKEKKLSIKTRSQWLAEAQREFNAYIRARDFALPCISCGVFGPRKWDAGHYRSVGACPELRFDEDNCHAQCVPCNQHRSGNAIDYRIGLLMRIGEERVNRLEGPHSPTLYSIDDIKLIIATYKQKKKALQSNPVYPV